MPPSKTILVIDDDENLRTYLAIVLRSAGYYVVEASTGIKALWAAERRRPDLALIDLAMPETCPDKLILDLHARWPGLPVLIISAQDPRTAPMGVPFLGKPFSPLDVRMKVEEVLGAN